MKWFTLSLALVCICALQIVTEAKPVEDEETAAVEETPVEETPAEDTPAEPATEGKPPKKKGFNIAKINEQAKTIMSTVKEAIDTGDQMLGLYDRVVDRVIPWKEFNETLVELDSFRKDYSVESAALIGEIKTMMMNGIDAYHSASQNVYEWAGMVVPLLNVYVKLFNDPTEQKEKTQKTLLLKVLDQGIEKMNLARIELERSSKNFNEAGGKLESLQIRFNSEFDQKSEYMQAKITQLRTKAYIGSAFLGPFGIAIAAGFVEGKYIPLLKEKLKSIADFYKMLKGKIQSAADNIDKTKILLQAEVRHIGELKIATEDTKTYINTDHYPQMRDEIIGSVHRLVKSCQEYRARHNSRESA